MALSLNDHTLKLMLSHLFSLAILFISFISNVPIPLFCESFLVPIVFICSVFLNLVCLPSFSIIVARMKPSISCSPPRWTQRASLSTKWKLSLPKIGLQIARSCIPLPLPCPSLPPALATSSPFATTARGGIWICCWTYGKLNNYCASW